MKFLGGVSAVGAPCVVGDDELERADSERARECIFARKRFPASPSTKNPPDNVGGIVRGDDGNRTRVISLED